MKLRHLILLTSLLATCIDAFLSSIRSWAHRGRALATERSARKQECLEESIQSLRHLTERIATRLNETDQLTPVSLPADLSYAEGFLCRDQTVKFSADAFTSSKLQYLRRVYFSGSGYDVFNIVAIPRSNINIPILGIDIVILPGEVLASIDFQPIDQTENHDIYSLNKLKLAKWKSLLPAGGKLPEGSESFFSSHGVWTRFPRDRVKAKLLFVEQAANEFTDIYASSLQSITERLSQPEAILRKEKIGKYLRYRRESDPAKRMLFAAFGKEWTNTVLETIIFPFSYESSASNCPSMN